MTLGALRVTQACVPLLRKGERPRIVNVSSGMGQLADMGGHWPAYRISKTALNALTRLFADVGLHRGIPATDVDRRIGHGGIGTDILRRRVGAAGIVGRRHTTGGIGRAAAEVVIDVRRLVVAAVAGACPGGPAGAEERRGEREQEQSCERCARGRDHHVS